MENVNVKNPQTGQVLTVPRKLYDSVYRDKGFDLIDRGSAEAAGSTGKPAKAAAGSKPPADKTGSAADIAKNLGIEGETGTEGMTFRSTRATAGLKLRGRGRRGLIVGANFHRASAPGQPPAIRTGRLINSIRGRLVGLRSARVTVGVGYGLPLDDPEGLNRPFFHSRAILYRPRFVENVRQAIGL
jgi:hypothetical protein